MVGYGKRLGMAIMAAAMLGGCASLPSVGGVGGGSDNYAAGSPANSVLSGTDRSALATAFQAAMNNSTPQQWRGNRAVGVVMPGGYGLANLLADPNARIGLAQGDLDLAHVMETDLGPYVLTRNTNLRKGPGTENGVIEILPSGSGVDVVGRIPDNNWMLVSMNGSVRGYVYGNLLIKAPGTELELAGGPMRRPILCREFTQRVSAYSERYQWQGAACNDGAGWRLAPPEAPLDDQTIDPSEF